MGSNEASVGWWWGENLYGVRSSPVVLWNQTKLVYSPHTYGPSVYMQEYFLDPRFPHNMQSIWETHFAFAQVATKQPLVIGEFGGKLVGKDREWQERFVAFLAQKQVG